MLTKKRLKQNGQLSEISRYLMTFYDLLMIRYLYLWIDLRSHLRCIDKSIEPT